MNPATIDQVLAKISAHLDLTKETETDVLAEIRTHLEDAIAEAVSRGENEQEALLKAAQGFGIDEAGAELQEVHANRESVDAVAATALPVLFAVILRWLAFAPDGSPVDWRQLLIQPGFIIVAVAALYLLTFGLLLGIFSLALWASEQNRPLILAAAAGFFLAGGIAGAAYIYVTSKKRHPIFENTIAVLKGDERGLHQSLQGTGDD